MGSLLDIIQQLRQGVWSSFTGGWYYDPYHKIFTNTIHLYLWLFFFCFPFSIHLYLPAGSHYLWIYTGIIFLVFSTIKFWNRVLHNLFDNGDVHEVTDEDVDGAKGTADETADSIELRDMSKTEYTDDWRMGLGMCVPSLRLPSIHEEGSGAGGSTAGGGVGGVTTGGSGGGASTDRSGGLALASSSREYGNSSRFDLKVDVHSKPGVDGNIIGPAGETREGTDLESSGGRSDRDRWSIVQPDEVIDIEPSEKSDVVILVDEDNIQHSPPSVPLATVLEEAKHPGGGGVSFDASNAEVSQSFSTTSSQLTMQGVSGGETTRRYSNISNLARSIRSEPGSNNLQPVTGSLEIMAILDPNLSQIGNRRRMGSSRNGRNVRRTKSVLDAGLGCGPPMSMSSYPVSLDAGMNQPEFRQKCKPSFQALKAMELQESQISEASEEGSLDRNTELMESDEEYQHKNDSKQSPDQNEDASKIKSKPEQDKESDINEAKKDTNIENPKEAVDSMKEDDNEVNSEKTKDEKETPTTTSKDISIQTDPNALSPNKYRILFLSGPPGRSPIKEGKLLEASVSEHPELLEAGSGEVVDEVQIKELNKKEIIDLMEEAGGDPSNLKELSEETSDGKKLKDKAYKWWEVLNGPDSSDEDKNNSPGEQPSGETESPKKKKIKESGEGDKTEKEDNDKSNSDVEDPDQPQSFLNNLGIDWLFSDSEPEDPALSSPKQVPSTNDEWNRGTVRKVENPLKAAAKSRDSSHGSSGTDTETRTLLNKLEEVEASLEAAGGAIPKRSVRAGSAGTSSRRSEDRMARRLHEYELPERTTLQEDAAGLKLFLEILNGSDTENPEAELELKKLIQSKREILEGNRQPEPHRTRRRLAQRRKRRHAAEPQPEEQYPPSEPQPEGTADPMKGNRVRRRRADRDKPPSGPGADTHLAENHEDTSTGAVHCFQDEYGNWQTYTFGADTASMATQLSAEYTGGIPPGPPCVAGGVVGSNNGGGSSGGGSSRSRVFPRSIFTGYTTDGSSRRPSYRPAGSASTHIGGSVDQDARSGEGSTTRSVGGGEGSTTRSVGGGDGSTTRSNGDGSTTAVSGYSNNPNYTANSRSSSESGFTVILDSPAMVFRPSSVDRQRSQDSNSDNFWSTGSGNRDNGNSGRYNVNASAQAFRRHNPFSFFTENLLDRLPGAAINTTVPDMLPFSSDGSPFLSRLEEGTGPRGALTNNSGNLGSMHSATPKVKKYHLLKFPGFRKGMKIWLDRLQMLNILDQDPSLVHTILSVILATCTAILGSMVIQEGYCKDLWLVLFCLVLCSSQYSLLKSVQPDASSPTHGFNIITVYSRPGYFIIFCSLALILDNSLKGSVSPIHLYNINWGNRFHLEVARDFVYCILLAFPVIFTLGLLPQINTAAMFLLEQVDMQIFGGNSSTSMQSSLYCVGRSALASMVLVGFAYGGLIEGTHSAHAQQVLFSIFCALAVSMAYHLSRASGDPAVLLSIVKRHFLTIISEDGITTTPKKPISDQEGTSREDPPGAKPAPSTPTEEEPSSTTLQDPLPKKLRDTVNKRLTNDFIMIIIISIIVFLVVQSDVFQQGFPYIDMVLWITALLSGVILHYVLPQMRKEYPWKCIAAPILKSNEQGQFEVHKPAVVMWWEKFLIWAVTLEKSFLYPAIFLSAVYQDKAVFSSLFGLLGGSLVMSICLLKCLRICYSDCSRQFVNLLLSILIFQYNPLTRYINNLDPSLDRASPFLLDYFLTSILLQKLIELYLKCQFVITYAAPHQINWGSPFHAFAQPFSVPHSAMLLLQAAVSSALSSPLNPFLGSTIFLCSYARPVKFWERNYNTKRVDNSNTRLSSQVEMRNPGADDNNLNSIFYEHLTRSLQHSLAGDIMLGRWGEVQQGDFFVLASDNLNCLVHIIELGNGVCTFQVRGLEFRGTYCHQREVEAITEGVEDDEGCCCCDPGHLPHILSLNAALSQRWLAWEVSAVKYVLEGYSISNNSAQSMLELFDLRKRLVSYYIKSIIYYTVRSPKLKDWLDSPTIKEAINNTSNKNFVDLDPLFNSNIDEDFDFRVSGITRSSFCNIYLSWIQYCARSRSRSLGSGRDSDLVSLCLALSLMGRRALGTAGHNALSTMEFFLVGLYSLFKGDFRITSVRDEWVFSDMELLRRVVAPAVRMSLKLHQDHFMLPDEYEDPSVLYTAITSHEKDLVISHEGDPAWRAAVLSGAPSLLALRHVVDDGSDEYKIIMLNKRFLSFRVIKLNRECVRGLWAGQQQELIFFRNRNPERGSIQNAKQVLRNIINSSCDQPLGYPIYVSPLTTSYSDTNEQITGVLGGPLSLGVFKSAIHRCWERIWDKCLGSCSTGSRGVDCDINTGGDCILPEHLRAGSLPGNRSSLVSSVSKPSTGTIVSLAGLLGSTTGGGAPGSTPTNNQRNKDDGGTPSIRSKTRSIGPQLPVARIIDPLMVYDNINLGRRIDPVWPEAEWRAKGGRNSWNNWIPMEEMKGVVLHRWTPLHPHPMHRSHTDKTILLLKIEDKYVPIAEHAVEIMYQDTTDLRRSPKIHSGSEAVAKSPAKDLHSQQQQHQQQHHHQQQETITPRSSSFVNKTSGMGDPLQTEQKTVKQETGKESQQDGDKMAAMPEMPNTWSSSTKLPTPPPLPPIPKQGGQQEIGPTSPLYSTSLSHHQAQGIPYMEADTPSTPPTPLTPPAPATPPASPSSLHRLPTPPSSPVSIRTPSPVEMAPLQSPIDDSISTLSPSGEMSSDKVDEHDQQKDLNVTSGENDGLRRSPASSDPLTEQLK